MDTHQLMSSRVIRFVVISASLLLPFTTYAEPNCRTCIKLNPLLAVAVGSATTNISSSNRFIVGESTYNFYSKGHTSQKYYGNIAIGAEYRFDPRWYFQAFVDYAQPRAFEGRGSVTQGLDAETADTYNYSYKILSRQVLFNGKVLVNICERFHPYGMFGIGAASNTAYNYNVQITPPFTTMSPLYTEDTYMSFSYAAGLGLDVDVDPLKHFRLGVGYRYTQLGEASLGSGVLNTTRVNNTLSQSNLYAHEYFAQLTYIGF